MFSLNYILPTPRILSLSTLILVICLIVIIYMPTPAQTHPLSLQDNTNMANKRYCSTALFEAIRLICEGRTNSLSSKYPESFGNRRPSLLRRLLSDDEDIFRPTLSGAAHECCRRPCGYSELHAYCED